MAHIGFAVSPVGDPLRHRRVRVAYISLIVGTAVGLAAGADTTLAELPLADGEWLIRVDIEGHEPTVGRLNVYSTGTFEYLTGKKSRDGEKWELAHAGKAAPADLRSAYESARVVVRDFKLADQARPDIARDEDGTYVFTFATARRAVRLSVAIGEQRRDERLTEDLLRLCKALEQVVPPQYLLKPRLRSSRAN